MLTALSDSLRLMQKLTASTRIMILIKPLMVLCLRTRLLILKLNNYTSMGISVMSSNLASLPTVLESSHIAFYNKNFIASHPDITVEKKSDSPDEDKSVHDSRLLIPTLKDFFLKHPLINPKTFLGDAAFDTAALYPKLLTGNTFGDHKHFDKAYIPLNSRAGLEKQDYTINENGIPCCPHDDSLPMKYEGISKLRSGVTRYKFVCPKIKWIKNASTGRSQRHCTCDDPCTASSCGRMVYIYPEKDLRAYPGAIRGTEEWNNTYKIRTTVERDINHIKDNLCLAGRRTQNEKTLHADLVLAGITQLITVVLSDKINHHEFIRSLKPLIA